MLKKMQFITKYRRKDVLSILKNVDENRIIQFLKSSFLPLEYKDYIVENNKEKLVSKIKSLSIIQVSFFHLTDSSLLPLDVKEMMFEVHKSGLIKKYSDLSNEQFINEIKFGSGDNLIKGLLIELNVNETNIKSC